MPAQFASINRGYIGAKSKKRNVVYKIKFTTGRGSEYSSVTYICFGII